MNKVIGIIALIVIVAAGVWYGIDRNHKNTNNPTTPSTSSSSNMATQPTSTNAVATDKVSIAAMAFTPSDITIAKGTMVTWTNNDNVSHTVTKDNPDTGPDSSALTPGAVYRFTYNQVGVFKYHCSIHPQMMGSVTVTQ